MNLGASMTRRRIVDRDSYQQESKPWPWWKYVLGSLAVAVFILLGAVIVGVFS